MEHLHPCPWHWVLICFGYSVQKVENWACKKYEPYFGKSVNMTESNTGSSRQQECATLNVNHGISLKFSDRRRIVKNLIDRFKKFILFILRRHFFNIIYSQLFNLHCNMNSVVKYSRRGNYSIGEGNAIYDLQKIIIRDFSQFFIVKYIRNIQSHKIQPLCRSISLQVYVLFTLRSHLNY